MNPKTVEQIRAEEALTRAQQAEDRERQAADCHLESDYDERNGDIEFPE